MKKAQWTAVSLLGLVFGAVRFWDLANYTDLNTGFTTGGALWLRYAAAFLPVALLVFFVLRKGKKMQLQPLKRAKPLAFFAFFTSMVLLFCGAACLWGARMGGAIPELVYYSLYIVSGLWFFVLYLYFAFPAPKGAPGGLLLAVPGSALFIALCIQRFAVQPAALARPGYILAVLTALSLMGLAVCVVRTTCIPSHRLLKWNILTGGLSFIFGFCYTLPQAVVILSRGTGMPAPETLMLLPEIAMGLFGTAFTYSNIKQLETARPAPVPQSISKITNETPPAKQTANEVKSRAAGLPPVPPLPGDEMQKPGVKDDTFFEALGYKPAGERSGLTDAPVKEAPPRNPAQNAPEIPVVKPAARPVQQQQGSGGGAVKPGVEGGVAQGTAGTAGHNGGTNTQQRPVAPLEKWVYRAGGNENKK